MSKLYEYEKKAWQDKLTVLGIDEAGRGPLAGPLVVAGVILKANVTSDLIDDSKKLTEKQRHRAFFEILNLAQSITIKIVSAAAIDASNIYAITKETMQAIADEAKAELILVDAMTLKQTHAHNLIKGDQRSISIAAASIIAKVIRDHIMQGYDVLYPDYVFKQHKGYPTAFHYQQLEIYGPCPIHRRSFKLSRQLSLF